jgi:hypothetical protein
LDARPAERLLERLVAMDVAEVVGAVQLSALSRENGRAEEVEERLKLGGFTGANVRRRFRIPMRFLVGERPAGAVRELVTFVLIFAAGERGVKIWRVVLDWTQEVETSERGRVLGMRVKLGLTAKEDVTDDLERLVNCSGAVFSVSGSES